MQNMKILGKKGHAPKKIRVLEGINPTLWLIFILLFALTLRLTFFVGMGFNDDSSYLGYAEQIVRKGAYIPHGGSAWETRIGAYIPVSIVWKLIGIGELSASLYFLTLSVGSVWVTYLLAKEFFNEKTSLTASFLLATFPLDIVYSTQIGPDIPFQFFIASATLFFIKNEKHSSRVCGLLSGLFLGLAYITKSAVALLLPVLIFYILMQIIFQKKNISSYFKKKVVVSYSLIAICFLLIFTSQVFYFYLLTGEWFFGEKTRQKFYTNDRNSNPDLYLYPNYMFNFDFMGLNFDFEYFQWIHDVPLFGFIYYFVLISMTYLILRKDMPSMFFMFWLVFFFFFFECGLQFYCTEIMDYCLYGKSLRFLSTISIPAVILVARFLESGSGGIIRVFSVLGLLFLTVTSISCAYQSSVFLGNGMGDVRETAQFIYGSLPRTIYLPDQWCVSKIKFFFRYNKTYTQNLKVYHCAVIDCNNEYFNKGQHISDAYVVTWLNPYTWTNRDYPEFMRNPPENWKLLKTIKLKNYGIFEKYDPKIYYVPP
ncbi:MAG: glycosyltransferase family 39 protein [Candidatus Altiarchaeales archaeon]|nr:glycosyltransferase family 39 protein [Candidatus Altiarchaeales archaeon]